jgi:hypothetical protein
MRLAGLRPWLFLAVALMMVGAVAGCDNPFDPLNTSDKIQGLTYFDFAANQAHWDSDPEWDGLQITMNYYNEFGDQLNFHDKPHKLTMEIYSEVEGATTTDPKTRGSLLASKTITYSNSDDLINLPIEYYGGSLGLPSTEPITGCLLIRVFPPQNDPQEELYYFTCSVELYTPEDALLQ